MAFNLTAKWCKGDDYRVPDALSHLSLWEPQKEDALSEYDEESLLVLSATETGAIVSEDNHNNV